MYVGRGNTISAERNRETEIESRDFGADVLAPERARINDDLDEAFDELKARLTGGGGISPELDLAEDENVQLNSHKPEREVVEEMNRFTVPRSDKGPKRLRPFSTREVGRSTVEEDAEWGEILNEDALQDAEQRDITPGEKYQEELEEVSLSVELYHNFTLFHDDINDWDEVRRLVPTGWVSEKEKAEGRGLEGEEAERHGVNIAMHEGNDLREFAHQMILDSGFTAEKKNEMARTLIGAGDRIIQGQVRDLSMEHIDLNKLFEGEDQPYTDFLIGDSDTAEDLYVDMIDKKTVDLYVASVDMGATAANASEEQRDHLRRFARNMGIPFQIRDDINEIRSVSSYTENGEAEDEDLGKEATDIYNGKTTLPVLTAYNNIEEKLDEVESDVLELDDQRAEVLQNHKRDLEYQKALIEGFYGREDITDDQLTEVADAIYKHETASDHYEEKIEKAIHHLEEAEIPGGTENLELLADYMKEREY